MLSVVMQLPADSALRLVLFFAFLPVELFAERGTEAEALEVEASAGALFDRSQFSKDATFAIDGVGCNWRFCESLFRGMNDTSNEVRRLCGEQECSECNSLCSPQCITCEDLLHTETESFSTNHCGSQDTHDVCTDCRACWPEQWRKQFTFVKEWNMENYDETRLVGFSNNKLKTLCYFSAALQLFLHTRPLLEFVTTAEVERETIPVLSMRLLMRDVATMYGKKAKAVPWSDTEEIQQRLHFRKNLWDDVGRVVKRIVDTFTWQSCDSFSENVATNIFHTENVVIFDSWAYGKKGQKKITVCDREYELHACAYFEKNHWVTFANIAKGWKEFNDKDVKGASQGKCMQKDDYANQKLTRNLVFTRKF
mmetsp:Transcript_67026/g.132166  ORF Transcript_67026/g.132166 Transcript_67026/m.132166 type:complete len:367 (-) Transcript_67026:33-1133(-)